ncbi:MAG: hypothetical protein NTZ17_12185 [Phycisphaerae bacterium]|nr:hypothetical protein [Phycisphaerae bacterium]
MPRTKKYVFNGIDGETGQYLLPPTSPDEIAALARGEELDRILGPYLKEVSLLMDKPHLGLPEGVDPRKVEQAGWAIVFHVDETDGVKKALEPLIERRRNSSGGKDGVRILDYRGGESHRDWLERHGTSMGSVDPKKVPYYLLVIGNPAKIPFLFTNLLGVEYAVGRLHFEAVGEYERYVRSLIAYETGSLVPSQKEVVFFATRHPGDRATRLSADLLARLLAGMPLPGSSPLPTVSVAEMAGFKTQCYFGKDALKAKLADVLRSEKGHQPAFLFTATHGVGFKKGHPAQREEQGAILCQDWPGLGHIGRDHYSAASDIPAEARVHGLISFHFACYSGGTPQHDRFIHVPGTPPPEIAQQPFLAALPQALLIHPNGGALACVGHVDRAWAYSFLGPVVGPQLLPFQNTISRILSGLPVGHAVKDFHEKYSVLSTSLSAHLEDIGYGRKVKDEILSESWIERNDAEGYIVLGDPAAHLRVDAMSIS